MSVVPNTTYGFEAACIRFAKGIWTKQMPSEAGAYFVLSSGYEPAGIRNVALDIEGKPFDVQGRVTRTVWRGFWFSMPIPDPTKVD